ncbi:hypothetical protein [Marinithermus hydrothermalis]|uniref:Uncharacterized protein n=1 Tax=Marinithermus hydrothermalis (strain DSM 14884 / JCM 11576 / T1) TaxID=869210 RepID=F2NNA7_MARHT|nr:hypothetical protein [Marinithermus hydrothermalis]AEB10948.1 hypothetical protein Marky_0185 [Marinithermus hydrothermalis DSM 14884]
MTCHSGVETLRFLGLTLLASASLPRPVHLVLDAPWGFALWGLAQLPRPCLDLSRKYSVLPGHLFGVAGIIDTLLDAYLLTREPIYLARLERQLEGLRTLHLFEPSVCASLLPQGRTLEGLAAPGEGLLRVSCDFATGCAGVLRVLHRVVNPGPADFMLDEVTPDEDVMDPSGGAQGRIPAPAGG